MNLHTKWILLCLAFLLAMPFILSAPIYSTTAINTSANRITFETFAAGTYTPITYNGVTITSSSAAQIRDQQYTQYTGIFEGKWLGFGIYTYTITFDKLVSETGLGIFDPNYTGIQLIARDSNNNILEVTSIATGPSGGGFSTFAGFKRITSDIKKIELVATSGDPLGIDNIMYFSAVPEPTSCVLLIVAIFTILRKKTR